MYTAYSTNHTRVRCSLSHPGVGPDLQVTVGVLADMDYECFDSKVCYPQGVLAALLNPASLGGVSATGGFFFCGDLAYANGNHSVSQTTDVVRARAG